MGGGASAPAQLSAADRATYLGDMSDHDVTTVIVGPATGSTQGAQLMAELLVQAGPRTGGVTVW